MCIDSVPMVADLRLDLENSNSPSRFDFNFCIDKRSVPGNCHNFCAPEDNSVNSSSTWQIPIPKHKKNGLDSSCIVSGKYFCSVKSPSSLAEWI